MKKSKKVLSMLGVGVASLGLAFTMTSCELGSNQEKMTEKEVSTVKMSSDVTTYSSLAEGLYNGSDYLITTKTIDISNDIITQQFIMGVTTNLPTLVDGEKHTIFIAPTGYQDTDAGVMQLSDISKTIDYDNTYDEIIDWYAAGNLGFYICLTDISSTFISNWAINLYNDGVRNLYFTNYYMVTDLQAPSLTGSNTMTIQVGTSTTVSSVISNHITATDNSDTNPTIHVASNTTFTDDSYKTIGTYYLYVYATDSNGNTSSTYKLTINVVDNVAPVLNVKQSEVSIGNKTKVDTATLISTYFSYSDNYYSSSDLTYAIVSDTYSANWNTVGSYGFAIRVTDPAGNSSGTEGITINVIDNTPPIITGANKTVGNDTLLSQTDLQQLFSISEETLPMPVDGFTITKDNYTANYNKVGQYTVTAQAKDGAGNTATATITITVEDKTAPTITGTNKTVGYNQTLSTSELKALFSYADETSIGSFELTTDNYTPNAGSTKLGSYTVVGKVTDGNGNSSTATITITIIDNVKPVITGANLNSTTAATMSEEDIKSHFTVTDEISGELDAVLTWVSNYYPRNVGAYTFTISSTDAAGNTQSQNFTITVVDGTAPSVWIDKTFVVVDTNTLLTDEMVMSYVACSLSLAIEDIESVEGEYESGVAGTYDLTANLKDGSAYAVQLSIQEGSEVETPEPENPEEPGEEIKWYDFGQIFNQAVENIFNFGGWNWMNYVFAVGAGFIVLSILSFVLKRRKK